MNTGAHTKIDVGIPPRDPSLAELTERATKAAVKEAFKLWTEHTETDKPDAQPEPKTKRPRANLVLVALVVLLSTVLAYTQYASYASTRDDREERIFTSLETIRRDQMKMQGRINYLFRVKFGDRAEPQTIDPLTDAISHGTQPD